MSKTILSILFFFAFFYSNANVPEKISSGVRGKVVDRSTSKGLEYATVMVYNQSDSSFVSGSITGPNGEFEIKLKPGIYKVKVQFLAYGTITVSDVLISRTIQLRDLGNLVLSPDDALLREAEVVAERSTVEMTLDKRVFNIGRDISSKASNAVEVLENIPSVTVDVEGNVSLRGDEGVRILIDGKMSGMAGIGSKNALRAISADMIERIEVITNPSVRYEAEGSSGIINIVLKRDRRKGYNGSIDLNAGFPWQAGLGLNTNYRLNKMNLFANYNINHTENQGDGKIYREIFSTRIITDQKTERIRRSFNNTLRVGADYLPNAKTSLSGSIMYRYSTGKNPSVVDYNDFINGSLYKTTQRREEQSDKDPTMEYALDLKRQFNNKDHQLTASFRHTINTDLENASIIEKVLFSQTLPYPDDLLQRMSTQQQNNSTQAQIDYFQPLRQKEKLETGIRFQNRQITNDYKVEQRDDTGNFNVMPEFSNVFRFGEDIFSAYLLYGREKNKISYQLGTRSELSKISTKLVQTGEENHSNYVDFFPSGHFTYKFNLNNSLQLSYSRRIRRPGFWQLNPFRTITDNRYIMTGNPGLKPVYTNAFEIGYLRFFKQGNINFNTYYRQSNDVFMRIERIDSTGIAYVRPENFASRDDLGVEIIGMANPYKWLNLNGSLNFFRSVTQGELYGRTYHVEDYSWTGRLMARANLKKGVDAQLTLNYQGKSKTPQGNRLPAFGADAGLSKDVLKNKGTLTLNIRDIFGTRRHAYETFDSKFYSKTEFRWTGTVVTLNFNYRINQQKKRAPERRPDSEEGIMEF